MEEYFFDSYAIIELIKGNPKYEFTKDLTLTTSVMNLAEVYYSLLLTNNKEIADTITNNLNLEFLDTNSDVAIKAAHFKFKNKVLRLSYIDCLGYILARESDLLFLTGDKGFKNLENVKFIPKE